MHRYTFLNRDAHCCIRNHNFNHSVTEETQLPDNHQIYILYIALHISIYKLTHSENKRLTNNNLI